MTAPLDPANRRRDLIRSKQLHDMLKGQKGNFNFEELLNQIIIHFGGVQGFGRELVNEFRVADAGSTARTAILRIVASMFTHQSSLFRGRGQRLDEIDEVDLKAFLKEYVSERPTTAETTPERLPESSDAPGENPSEPGSEPGPGLEPAS